MNTKRIILGMSLASLVTAGLALPGVAAADKGGRDWGRYEYRDHHRGDRYRSEYRYRRDHDHDRHYYRPYKRHYYSHRHDHDYGYGYWLPGAALGLHFIFHD